MQNTHASKNVSARRECGACKTFVHDEINPAAGLGQCIGVRNGEYIYAGVDPRCRGWTERPIPASDSAAVA